MTDAMTPPGMVTDGRVAEWMAILDDNRGDYTALQMEAFLRDVLADRERHLALAEKVCAEVIWETNAAVYDEADAILKDAGREA